MTFNDPDFRHMLNLFFFMGHLHEILRNKILKSKTLSKLGEFMVPFHSFFCTLIFVPEMFTYPSASKFEFFPFFVNIFLQAF